MGDKLGMCTVGNPGISYSDLLILIPGSRVIFTWSPFMLFILQRSRPLSMMSLWHHGSRLLSLIYGVILTPYDTTIVIHLISQWPLSLLSFIRAVYLIISNCKTCTNRYRAVYKTGLTASLNNELSCSHSPIISTLSSLPLCSSYSFVVSTRIALPSCPCTIEVLVISICHSDTIWYHY